MSAERDAVRTHVRTILEKLILHLRGKQGRRLGVGAHVERKK
jgi:hypothetical protein